MVIGIEWIGQGWFIASLISMAEEILSAEPCDVLLDCPEAYFAGGPLKVPSLLTLDHIAVSIAPKAEVGIDLRNLMTYRDWKYRLNDSDLQTIPADVEILNIGVKPQQVKFFFNGSEKAHTTIQFFIEKPTDEEEED